CWFHGSAAGRMSRAHATLQHVTTQKTPRPAEGKPALDGERGERVRSAEPNAARYAGLLLLAARLSAGGSAGGTAARPAGRGLLAAVAATRGATAARGAGLGLPGLAGAGARLGALAGLAGAGAGTNRGLLAG